jgi:hypothetical protein
MDSCQKICSNDKGPLMALDKDKDMAPLLHLWTIVRKIA